MIDSRVVNSHQGLVNSKVKPQENEEARRHDSHLDAQLGAAIVVQLILVEDNIVVEQHGDEIGFPLAIREFTVGIAFQLQ